MKTAKTSKRALLCSVLSIALCLSMLIGTTFAWFTDTASTGVSKITSGSLHVAIQDKDGNPVETLSWVAKDGRAQDQIYWEPGCTYTLTPFKIVNTGTLALKYKMVITGLDGDSELLKVIHFSYTIEGQAEALELGHEGKLAANNGKTGLITVSATMDTTAGNKYQEKTLTGVSIKVYATQDTVEYDSTGNTYDAKAAYPVADAGELKKALTEGGNVTVNNNIVYETVADTVEDRTIISQPTTMYLDAKIKTPDNMGNNNKNFCALIVDADTTINATENGGIDTGLNGGYGINVRKGAKLTINGGSYYGGGTAVQVQEGTLTINGGTFACEPFGDPYGYNFLLNCVDAAYKNGTAKIIVKGGTFVNFDPSNNTAEGAGTNFVADGYKVVSETQANGNVWYTVVAD